MKRVCLIFFMVFCLIGLNLLASGDLGLSFSGTSTSPAVLHVAKVTLRVTLAGGVGNMDCSAIDNGASYDVNEYAKKIKFVIHYQFINERIAQNQRFTCGYRVYKVNDDGSEEELSKSDRKIDKTIGPRGTVQGDCTTPEISFSGDTKFKIMILYDIYGVKNGSTTRIVYISPTPS